MAFEVLFGVLGLISKDSKSLHKCRLENEWRLPTAFNANPGRDAGSKSPVSRSMSPTSNLKAAFDGQPAFNGEKQPIFSTSGTLTTSNSSLINEGAFSSASSSSASSIASSGSTLTINSTSALIKSGEHPKKYEFRLNLIGDKGSDIGGADFNDDSVSVILKDTATSSSTSDLSSESQNENQGSDDQELSLSGPLSAPHSNPLRRLYCLAVCACLWLSVGRLVAGLLLERSLFTLDFYCLGAYKIHFLIPAMCLAIQAAAVATLFIRNNHETNWLVPFYSSKDYLIRSRSNFKPKIEEFTRRVNVSIAVALVLAMFSAVSLSAYLVHCAGESDIMQATQVLSGTGQQSQLTQYETIGSSLPTSSYGPSSLAQSTIISLQQQQQHLNKSKKGAGMDEIDPMGSLLDIVDKSQFERTVLMTLLAMDVLWIIYSTYICFVVSFYFNLICSIMRSRFHGISKIIEALAETNSAKTSRHSRKMTNLYLEHNEACELLDESNDFWQYLIFFTYFTYIPAYCYCLYNLFFVDFETWPSFITWVIHTHTGFIILLISFSAAGVSTEVSFRYISTPLNLPLYPIPSDFIPIRPESSCRLPEMAETGELADDRELPFLRHFHFEVESMVPPPIDRR